MRKLKITRGEIWMVDLGYGEGSEQRGKKPCLVIQNDVGNNFSSTTVVVPITSKSKNFNRTHVTLEKELLIPSSVLCEQVRVVDKIRLLNKIGNVGIQKMREIEQAMMLQLGIGIQVESYKNSFYRKEK